LSNDFITYNTDEIIKKSKREFRPCWSL